MKRQGHEPNNPYVLPATRVKHPPKGPKHIIESNKHGGSRNGMKARKERIQIEMEHTQKAQAPPTYTHPIHRR